MKSRPFLLNAAIAVALTTMLAYVGVSAARAYAPQIVLPAPSVGMPSFALDIGPWAEARAAQRRAAEVELSLVEATAAIAVAEDRIAMLRARIVELGPAANVGLAQLVAIEPPATAQAVAADLCNSIAGGRLQNCTWTYLGGAPETNRTYEIAIFVFRGTVNGDLTYFPRTILLEAGEVVNVR